MLLGGWVIGPSVEEWFGTGFLMILAGGFQCLSCFVFLVHASVSMLPLVLIGCLGGCG